CWSTTTNFRTIRSINCRCAASAYLRSRWAERGCEPFQPDRGDLVDLAYQKDANDDVIDALDS
ncbi:MAG TPA: hypothetical protein VN697_06570, partial [Tepidiformaceae bacterium]|nr:hypothetical protein [Tepidiformaceae bacterium]